MTFATVPVQDVLVYGARGVHQENQRPTHHSTLRSGSPSPDPGFS